MLKAKSIFFIFSCIVLFSSCKKSEEVVVPKNTAPPDSTVSSVVKETYINKLYISVLGRKPLSVELDEGMSILKKNNLSIANRYELLDKIFAKPEYNGHIYNITRQDLLNNIDTSEITNNIYILNFLLTDTAGYGAVFDLIKAELKRLEAMKAIPVDMDAGTINIIELQKRCINNMFYDEINMGTENFVVSMYQHFFFRYPSEAELEMGSDMVDGLTSVVMLQVGKSKDDFIKIFFSSDNYFEGQVRNLFQRYLFKEPSSEEATLLANKYKASLSFKEIQKEILSRDDFAGLK